MTLSRECSMMSCKRIAKIGARPRRKRSASQSPTTGMTKRRSATCRPPAGPLPKSPTIRPAGAVARLEAQRKARQWPKCPPDRSRQLRKPQRRPNPDKVETTQQAASRPSWRPARWVGQPVQNRSRFQPWQLGRAQLKTGRRRGFASRGRWSTPWRCLSCRPSRCWDVTMYCASPRTAEIF